MLINTVYESDHGVVSYKIEDLFSETITISKKFPRTHKFGRIMRDDQNVSLFPKIKIKNIDFYPDIIDKPYEPKTISYDEFIKMFLKISEKNLIELWNPEDRNIVCISSGYDSRMLILLMAQQLKKRGREWMGDSVFTTVGEEEKSVRNIIDHLQIPKNLWVPLPYLTPDSLNYVFDFDNIWKKINGVGAAPLNLLKYVEDSLTKDTTKKTVIWSAIYTNAIFDKILPNCLKLNKNPVQLLEQSEIGHRMNHYRSALKSKVQDIFVEKSIMTFFSHYRTEKDFAQNDTLRKNVITSIDKKLVIFNRLRNVNKKLIPTKLLLEMKQKYESSWYCKNVNPHLKIRNCTYAPKTWCHWTAASFLEYMIKQGMTINKPEK